MTLINIKYNYRTSNDFINDNIGDTKPNVLNNNLVPYFIYENEIAYNIDPLDTNDDTIIEALDFFNTTGNIAKLTTLLDYILFTTPADFGISRILEINPNVFVGNGKTPYIYQYLYDICYETYNKTADVKYLNKANEIKLFLTNGDSYSPDSTYITYAGVSSIVMYDINNLLISNRRYGFYISDINPLAWLYSENEEALNEAVKIIEDSQNKFSILTSNTKGLVYPYFNRNIQENNDNNIMPIGDWTFYGILGNETDLIHSYTTMKNLAEYYYKKFSSYDINRDVTARNVIKNFIDYCYSYYSNNGSRIPDSVDYKEGIIYVNNTRLTVNETNVFVNSTFSQIDIIPSKNGYSELYKKCLLALVCYYKWKVDNYEPAILFLNSLILDIKKYQGYANNTIVDNSDLYVNNTTLTVNDTNHHVVSSDIPINNGIIYNQIVFLMSKLFYLYKNVPKKTGTELINESFKLLELPQISILNENTNYYAGSIKDKFNTIINEILASNNYDNNYYEYILPYSINNYSWNLLNQNINLNRISNLFFQYNNSNIILLPRTIIDINNIRLNNSNTGVPRYYSINDNSINIYPTPDKDYQIIVAYYRDDYSLDYLDQLVDIPLDFYSSIKYSLIYEMAMTLNLNSNIINTCKILSDLHMLQLSRFNNPNITNDRALPRSVRL